MNKKKQLIVLYMVGMCGFRLKTINCFCCAHHNKIDYTHFLAQCKRFLQFRENYQSYDGLLVFDNFQAIPRRHWLTEV